LYAHTSKFILGSNQRNTVFVAIFATSNMDTLFQVELCSYSEQRYSYRL